MVRTNDADGESRRSDSGPRHGSTLALVGALAVLVAIAAGGAVGASAGPVGAALGSVGDAGGALTDRLAATHDGNPDPVARCTLSETSIEVGDSVTLDASASENGDSYQYQKDRGLGFGEYYDRDTQTYTYREAGTYEPRVKVWNYDGGEESEVDSCGTLEVTDPTPTPTPTPEPSPVARCTVSDTSVQVGEEVTIDASASSNVDDYQYDKYGDSSFGDYIQQDTQTVTYGEVGTYNPRVRVWGGPTSEQSDTDNCGTVTVTDDTPTPTPFPTTQQPTPTSTPAPSPVARCTVSDTSVQVGEEVTIDASASSNVEDYQYDKYGSSSFGDYTDRDTRTVTYGEVGTYDPRVRVWSYTDGEQSDTDDCGTITVTEGTPTATTVPEQTPTPTATPDPGPTARCRSPDFQVSTGERVILDATDSTGAESYVFSKFAEGPFVNESGGATITIRYQEAGTYEPAVRVTDAQGRTDTATCGEISVTPGGTTASPTTTGTPTPTGTATPVPTADPTVTTTPTSVPTATRTPTATAVPTADPTDTPDSGDGGGDGGEATTTTQGRLWFEYSPEDPSADDSVTLSAQPRVDSDSVAAYRWHLNGDESPDRTGRTVDVPASTDGSTTQVTLVVERTDGTTEEVSRPVPVEFTLSQGDSTTDTPGGAAAAGGIEATTASGSGGPGLAMLALLVLLLLLVVAVIVVLVARRRLQALDGEES